MRGDPRNPEVIWRAILRISAIWLMISMSSRCENPLATAMGSAVKSLEKYSSAPLQSPINLTGSAAFLTQLRMATSSALKKHGTSISPAPLAGLPTLNQRPQAALACQTLLPKSSEPSPYMLMKLFPVIWHTKYVAPGDPITISCSYVTPW